MTGTVHIVGAGMAGLSAAVALSGRNIPVQIWEATAFAGGRCRSYYDAALDQTIDNGNHLILSGNKAVYAYLTAIGAQDCFAGPGSPEFAFADAKTGARWIVRMNEGKFPWWIFSKNRRVPGTRARDYLRLARLLRKGRDRRLDAANPCRGVLWERLLHPFLVAALNTEPETASTALIGTVMRETLAKGGGACGPHIASPTLAAAFIDPALVFTQGHGAQIHFGQRLQRLVFDGPVLNALEFSQNTATLSETDVVILAVPPGTAKTLLPHISVPDAFRSIVSGHFRIAPPPDAPVMIGVLSATIEWIFLFPDRISVTVSNADRIIDDEREHLARLFWREVAAVLDLPETLPPWQIVKEKRATIAATPEQNAKRPGGETAIGNLFLAGDWTDTGLPSTLEGAVRSGQRAAELAIGRMRL